MGTSGRDRIIMIGLIILLVIVIVVVLLIHGFGTPPSLIGPYLSQKQAESLFGAGGVYYSESINRGYILANSSLINLSLNSSQIDNITSGWAASYTNNSYMYNGTGPQISEVVLQFRGSAHQPYSQIINSSYPEFNSSGTALDGMVYSVGNVSMRVGRNISDMRLSIRDVILGYKGRYLVSIFITNDSDVNITKVASVAASDIPE